MRDSSEDLEQVQVRGMNRRSLRLEWVAGLGAALAMLVLTVAAASAQSVATETSMSVMTSDQGGQTNTSVLDERDWSRWPSGHGRRFNC